MSNWRIHIQKLDEVNAKMLLRFYLSMMQRSAEGKLTPQKLLESAGLKRKKPSLPRRATDEKSA